MTTQTEALKLALEALEDMHIVDFPLEDLCNWNKAITAIKEALAQPEQDTCKGCNGNGVVGNILDTDTCPFCKGSGIEAQPEQEPVDEPQPDGVVVGFNDEGQALVDHDGLEEGWVLYTTPPQPEQEPNLGGHDVFFPVGITRPTAEEVSRKPEQEPVAWGIIASNTGRICQVELDADEVEGHNPKHIVPLYTTPPAQRKPLTDEQIFVIKHNWITTPFVNHLDFARAIEAAHGIKE